MHNWAFENIEVSQDFDVVPGVVSVKDTGTASRVPVTDAKLPVMINGVGQIEVTASQVTKAMKGHFDNGPPASYEQAMAVVRDARAALRPAA